MKTTAGAILTALLSALVLPSATLIILFMLAVTIDFITGFGAAVILRQQRTSEALRRTFSKVFQYGGAVTVCIIFATTITQTSDSETAVSWAYLIPNIMCSFGIYIESVSILENCIKASPKSVFAVKICKPLIEILLLKIEDFKGNFSKVAEK